MPKTIFFFLHPKTISAAELGYNGKLTHISVAGKSQVPCETIEELDSFCESFLEFYNIDELTDLEASYFIIDAGAPQEIRARLFFNFKRCPRVSSLFVDQAIPCAVLGKSELNLSSDIEVSYNSASYQLSVAQNGVVKVESSEPSSQNSITIRDEDFAVLVQPVSIQLNGNQEKLKIANAEIERLRERLDLLEKAEARRKFLENYYSQGKYVKFGQYEWIVLERQDNRALLITRNAVERHRFDQKSNSWATSEIRDYLNEDFYRNAFSDEERKQIIQTEIETSGITKDYIFLLSRDEVQRYFNSDQARKCLFEGQSWYYWLRSPGSDSGRAAVVGYDGYINDYGRNVRIEYAVRPALWVNLES